MSLQVQQKRGKQDNGSSENGGVGVGEKVLVAVKASKEIPKAALIWALTHVVQHGDSISLIVLVPPQNSGRKLWVFPRFAGDCASTNKRANIGTTSEQKCEITDSYSQMILQLHEVYYPNKINMKIKIVSASTCGAVVAEAKRVHASWVILEKDLKIEEKRCTEELQCNIVAMRRSHPKVLRLSLVGSPTREFEYPESSCSSIDTSRNCKEGYLCPVRVPAVTPSSSPDPFTGTEAGTSSVSSSDMGASPFFIPELNFGDLSKKKGSGLVERRGNRELLDTTGSETASNISTPCSSINSRFQPWMGEYLKSQKANPKEQISPARALLEQLAKLEKEACAGSLSCISEMDFAVSMREAMSIPRSGPMGPPPLCSICHHKAPVFGKPPRWFSYAELELATAGFSRANFLAEGGYGSVHRGIMPNGQAIAVKQHKLASSQGDDEFCSEVEVLSCAQHRNVVMLIGYCIEDKRRLLVYEYICNRSLDSHLYGRDRDPLEWYARQKIAVGAARGLRYLHEECRVGCIIHRDMRPNNILLTHDYEPLVGDFGLARWQPDGDSGVETRVIGTFGYLAPEYAQSGQITEKADVYSFGVILVELLTGRKAVDLSRPKGQQCLTEWARPLLEEYAVDELIDPHLRDRYAEQEVNCMIHAASLCIRRDPHSRPRMSQVLRILEGDVFIESSYLSAPSYDGNHSGKLQVDQGQLLKEGSEVSSSFSFDSVRAVLWSRDTTQITSDYKK